MRIRDSDGAKGMDVGLSRVLVKPQVVFCKDVCEYSYRVCREPSIAVQKQRPACKR